MRRSVIAIAALVACSGAWAQPPASEGWKKLDFICSEVNTGQQTQQWFYVNENEGISTYEEKYPASDVVNLWHYSDEMSLQKNIFGGKGQLTGIDEIDRSTGRMTWTDVADDRIKSFDCELRSENKF